MTYFDQLHFNTGSGSISFDTAVRGTGVKLHVTVRSHVPGILARSITRHSCHEPHQAVA